MSLTTWERQRDKKEKEEVGAEKKAFRYSDSLHKYSKPWNRIKKNVKTESNKESRSSCSNRSRFPFFSPFFIHFARLLTMILSLNDRELFTKHASGSLFFHLNFFPIPSSPFRHWNFLALWLITSSCFHL